MTADVRTADTLDQMSRLVADELVRVMRNCVQQRGGATIALAGGNTPRTLYRLLASEYRDGMPWGDLHVFWGDERYVPATDSQSNYRMARETLLDHVPCPANQIHAMPTGFAQPADAAEAYAGVLRDAFESPAPQFDAILLGLGADGHTASLFPHSPALREAVRPVVAVTAPASPPVRLTLTMSVLTRARHVFVLLDGPEKATALGLVLAPGADPDRYPAAGLVRAAGQLIWWVARMP